MGAVTACVTAAKVVSSPTGTSPAAPASRLGTPTASSRDRCACESPRAIAEELSEEELAVFDRLTKPEMDLTKSERKQVKKIARELLAVLKREKLVLDWRNRQQSRAEVRLAIELELDKLPEKYVKPTTRASRRCWRSTTNAVAHALRRGDTGGDSAHQRWLALVSVQTGKPA